VTEVADDRRAPERQLPQREFADLLRGAGLRVTAARLVLMDELSFRPHADVEELAAAVDDRLGGFSKQALYDALRALGTAGLVRRIEPAGSPSRFELRAGDNHHHVVCRVCGAAADVDCAVGSAPCLDPSQTHGYLLDEAEVTFWGVCPDCQQQDAPVNATEHSNAREE
jgi:Fur family transcriptional regulator, stress-responsive regulator